jgi:uncharacterized protein
MPHFAVTYAYADRSDDLDIHRPAHRAFLSDLQTRGDLVVCGPYVDHDADGPGALLIVVASDAAAAGRLLDDDPFALTGLITRRMVREWNPVIGTLAPPATGG